MLVYYGSMGWDTNNSAELEGLWHGMQLAQLHNFFPIEIEGDFQIIINMISKILSGSLSSRVADSWRLMVRLELIAE
jgi:ribonuclease HI